MAKATYKLLLEKSIQAALCAIELYNKPIFSYREESFSILMVNSWELLLKAKTLKDNKNKLNSLYVLSNAKIKSGERSQRLEYKKTKSGNFITKGISALIDKNIQDENLKKNLEALVEIRDNAIHFLNKPKDIKKTILEVATASLKSYKIITNEWFKESLDKYDLFLIPIAFNIPQTFAAETLSKDNKKFLSYMLTQISQQQKSSKHSIALVIDIKFNRSNGGICVKNDKDGIPVYQDSEEVFANKYPLSYDELIGKLKNRDENFKRNKSFNEKMREIKNNKELFGLRYLNYAKKSGMKKGYYSSNALKEFS